MDKAKLAQLRRKKLEANKKIESEKHQAVINSQKQVVESVNKLAEILESKDNKDILEVIKSIDTSKELQSMIDMVNKLDDKSEQSSKDLTELIAKNTAKQNEAIAEIASKLSESIQKQNIKSQEPLDFVPTRRVRKIGNRLVFDDDPMQVSVVGGGGIGKLSKISIVESIDFPGVFGMVVLNPDGSTISNGGTPVTPNTYDNGRYGTAIYS